VPKLLKQYATAPKASGNIIAVDHFTPMSRKFIYLEKTVFE